MTEKQLCLEEAPGKDSAEPPSSGGQKTLNTIGLAFNLRKEGCVNEAYEEYDDIHTIESLRREIEKYGYEVLLYEQDDDFQARLRERRPDLMINIAEGIGTGRSRESQVPCLLESMGIAYSGSDPVALGITLDKYVTSALLDHAKIPVPAMHLVSAAEDLAGLPRIFRDGRRYIVKPRWEGSSKGVHDNSVVDNFADLKARAKDVLKKHSQPAVIEEFMPGDEITAGICGNNRPELLGMMKIEPTVREKDYFLYSIEYKREWETKIVYRRQDTLGRKVRQAVEKYALAAFRCLELRDMARIDFRLDSKGVPHIIDVNPLPGMSPEYSDLPILVRLNGGTYTQLFERFLRTAITRHGFAVKF
ncbi:MAG: ATP-grasp domain-containing protein [Elusimicrobiaceae bacterium]|nr:ATP-grasp domain-containing protein [Elusimicrobiaceae bacterium]